MLWSLSMGMGGRSQSYDDGLRERSVVAYCSCYIILPSLLRKRAGSSKVPLGSVSM